MWLQSIYGYGEMNDNWLVRETRPCGYSRIYFIESGDITYRDSVREFKLLKNHMYIFPTESAYSIEHVPPENIRCVWIHVDMFPVMIQEPLDVEYASPDGKITDPMLYHLMMYAKSVFKSGIKVPLQPIITVLDDYLNQKNLFPKFTGKTAEMLQFIRNNYGNSEFTVDTIASAFGYTKEHVIRLFRSEVGIPPFNYLLNYRLRKAQSLLCLGVSVKETAEKVGYGDAKTFANSFRKHCGICPKDYRSHSSPVA